MHLLDRYTYLFPGRTLLRKSKACFDTSFISTFPAALFAMAVGQLAGLSEQAQTLCFAPLFVVGFPFAHIFMAWWMVVWMGMLAAVEWPFKIAWRLASGCLKRNALADSR
ncbi:hypothetical protein O9X98_06205 [Agrobacterium salinitolerans]|nr:hypothetical protein [Agrobacterium salinitolerans]